MRGDSIAALPPFTGLFGPLTRQRLLRLGLVYLGMVLVGSALILAPLPEGWRVAGMGLLWPGGGFWAHSDVCTQAWASHGGAAVASLAVFGATLVLWFATGNVLAPPLAWLGLAVLAAGTQVGPVAPDAAWPLVCALLTMLALGGVGGALRWHGARRRRAADQAYLAQACVATWAGAEGGSEAKTEAKPEHMPEMSLSDLQALRFALDRALQPVASLEGFERRDQFQTAAWRYQINFLAYGLALNQARYTPAFAGYVSEAQQNLLRKVMQARVWAYWAWENLWGNLRWSRNPLGRDNIMFTGFVALQMKLAQAASPLQVAGGGAEVAPDVPWSDETLLASLQRELSRSAFTLSACEPNWIYPLCNLMSASALMAHDAQHGTRRWQAHASAFRAQLEAEFLDHAGRLVPCRSSLTGLALPAIGGAMPQALPCFFLNLVAPDIARRQWALLRRELLDERGHLRRQAFWRVDTGNYGRSRASAYATTALAAAELGDDDVRDQCLAAFGEECPLRTLDGVSHHEQASVWAHGVALMARSTKAGGFRGLMLTPTPIHGPYLTGASYPDVLVASAHVDAMTGQLNAVLYPGAGPGVQALEVHGLQPFELCRLNGAVAQAGWADRLGRLRVHVVLQGRTCLSLVRAQGLIRKAA